MSTVPDTEISPSAPWSSAALTDVGRVRRHNEDAFLHDPQHGLWVVADGMGGHAAGDYASQTTVDALRDLDPVSGLDAAIAAASTRIRAVNTQLRHEASRRGVQTIGTTLVALFIHQNRYACLWAGDSRLYRLRGEHLSQLTHDHSLVEELVSKGIVAPSDAATHPASNVITRALGADDTIDIDFIEGALQPGDTLLLCSDGLYKEARDPDIAAALAAVSATQACQQLMDLTLSRGARDNVTLVVIRMAGVARD